MSQFSTSQVARLAAASTSESVQLSTPALTRGIELMDGIEENPLDVYTAENNALGLRVGVVSQNFELLSKLRSRTLLTSDQEYMAESLQWFEKFRKLLSVGGYARLGPCAKTIVDARDIPLLAGGCIALCDVLLYRSSSCKAGQTSLAEALRSSELEEELQLLRRSSARCEVSHQLWDSFLEALQQRRLLPEAELHYLLRRIRIGQEIHQHDTHGNRDSVLGDMNSVGVVLDHHLHSLYRVRPQLFEEACSTDPIISTPKGAGKSSRVEISVVSAFDGGVDSSIETATERKQLTDWDCCLPRGESEGLSRDRVCGRVLTSVVAAGNGVDLGSDDGRSRFEKEREAERVERSPPSADSNGFHRFIASLDASTLARLCAIRKEDVVALARDLQPGDCFCSVCRRRRAFIWESLGNLFDLYYQILESDQRMTEKSTAEELTSKSNGCQVFDEAPLVPISGIDEEDEDIERPSVVNGEACLRQILEARSGALVLSIDRMNQQGMDLNTLVERLSESRWRLRYGTLGTGPSGAFENVVDRNAAGTEWQSGDIRLISKPDAGRVSGFNHEHDSMRQELNRLVLPFREDFVAYRGVWEEVLECYIYSRVLEFVMRMRREGKLDINGNVVCEADEYSRANLAQAEKRETTATNSASCIPGTEHIPGGRKLFEVYLARLLERRLVGAYREMKAFECQKALLEEEAAEGFRSHKQRKKSKKRCGKDRKVAVQPPLSTRSNPNGSIGGEKPKIDHATTSEKNAHATDGLNEPSVVIRNLSGTASTLTSPDRGNKVRDPAARQQRGSGKLGRKKAHAVAANEDQKPHNAATPCRPSSDGNRIAEHRCSEREKAKVPSGPVRSGDEPVEELPGNPEKPTGSANARNVGKRRPRGSQRGINDASIKMNGMPCATTDRKMGMRSTNHTEMTRSTVHEIRSTPTPPSKPSTASNETTDILERLVADTKPEGAALTIPSNGIAERRVHLRSQVGKDNTDQCAHLSTALRPSSTQRQAVFSEAGRTTPYSLTDTPPAGPAVTLACSQRSVRDAEKRSAGKVCSANERTQSVRRIASSMRKMNLAPSAGERGAPSQCSLDSEWNDLMSDISRTVGCEEVTGHGISGSNQRGNNTTAAGGPITKHTAFHWCGLLDTAHTSGSANRASTIPRWSSGAAITTASIPTPLPSPVVASQMNASSASQWMSAFETRPCTRLLPDEWRQGVVAPNSIGDQANPGCSACETASNHGRYEPPHRVECFQRPYALSAQAHPFSLEVRSSASAQTSSPWTR